MDILGPALDQIAKLWARIDLMPVVRWGTITQTSPLRVQLDGDMEPMVLTPMSIVSGLRANDRVLCVEQHRRVIVLGRGRGTVLAGNITITGFTPDSNRSATVTFPAGMFSTNPVVTVSAGTSAPQNAMASKDITPIAAGFTVYGWRGDSVTSLPVQWIATPSTEV